MLFMVFKILKAGGEIAVGSVKMRKFVSATLLNTVYYFYSSDF